LREPLGIAVSILAEDATGSYSVFSVRESPELTKYRRWAWFL